MLPTMRILGIDPGIATIGLGLIERCDNGDLTPIEWLTIETAPGNPLPFRLQEIHRDLDAYLREALPERVVLETLYFATNAKTALDVAHGRGVIALTVSMQNIPIIEVSPLQLKNAVTGDGKADKRQVQDMVQRLLNLDVCPRPDDAADALALAIYGSMMHATLQL